MNFKKRKIRQHFRTLDQKFHEKTPEVNSSSPSPETVSPYSSETISPQKKDRQHHYINWITVGAGLLLVFGLFWITIGLIKSLDFGSVVFSFGKELKKNQIKQTNFLLVGVGGVEHDGGNLTDTIIVASLDENTHQVKMLSIPRDMYIDSKELGGQRVNKIYDTYKNKLGSSSAAMRSMASEITTITGVPIQYYLKINFNGFVKIVDALGGVNVDVEKRIYDPEYPLGETIKYTTFEIDAGPQTLDGETALKFARSRHSTSDFDRAKRQQQLLAGIKEKALSINLLTDPAKIQALYNSVADSIETDLSVAEIIELAKIAKEIPKNSIESRVISDDFTSCGGFLYTPNRDYFGGAAVLLPAGNNFNEIKDFAKNYFASTESTYPEIQVLNGTKTSGLALNYLNRLSRQCLNVVYYGNATDRDLKNSTIYYSPLVDTQGNKTLPESLGRVKEIIDAPEVEGIPPEYLESVKRANTQIVVELGADYKGITSTDSFDKLLYTEPTPETTPTEATPEKPLNSGTTTSSSTTKPTPSKSDSTPAKTTSAVSPATSTQPLKPKP